MSTSRNASKRRSQLTSVSRVARSAAHIRPYFHEDRYPLGPLTRRPAAARLFSADSLISHRANYYSVVGAPQAAVRVSARSRQNVAALDVWRIGLLAQARWPNVGYRNYCRAGVSCELRADRRQPFRSLGRVPVRVAGDSAGIGAQPASAHSRYGAAARAAVIHQKFTVES